MTVDERRNHPEQLKGYKPPEEAVAKKTDTAEPTAEEVPGPDPAMAAALKAPPAAPAAEVPGPVTVDDDKGADAAGVTAG